MVDNLLNIEEALNKVKAESESSKRNFTESVDLALKLGIDPKQSNQNIKGSILLPSGLGKKVKVIVISDDESKNQEAKDQGAIDSGYEDLIAKIESGFLDFDTCIATPNVMPKIAKIAKKLGPRGLMPSPKNGTVTNDIKTAVNESLKGKVQFKNDKSGIIHCSFGKIDFESGDLLANLKSIIKAVKDSKPESSKGKFLKSLHINTTMGRSVEVDIATI